MLSCWGCGHPFTARMVQRDSLLRSRAAANGGPYQLYRCPQCRRESRVETTPRGRLFASPDREINLVEYLFSWIEGLTPRDFLQLIEWHQTHGDRRRHFFLRDGDGRYARGGWLERALLWWRRRGSASRAPVVEPPPGPVGEAPRTRPSGGVPHPYRILGVPAEATPEEIRAAFRKLARQWHPDKRIGDDPEQLAAAARRLAELVAAYDTLQSPAAGARSGKRPPPTTKQDAPGSDLGG